ncbi:MAG: imidazoleglycerol-phosphate dehydratase [Synergistales bacterium]|nr:imidazoleglycerol-phosphate dehydratase [Synergistales bacterium]
MATRRERKTRETEISLLLDTAPEKPASDIDVDCGFIGHMLTLLAHHGRWSLVIRGRGDEADDHHLVEDLALLLGSALLEEAKTAPRARYGWCALPMDGTLVLAAVDISGRGSYTGDLPFPVAVCRGFDLELIDEFFRSLARESKMTIHLRALAVDNSHHLAEAAFKGLGRALRQALEGGEGEPSSKGAWL